MTIDDSFRSLLRRRKTTRKQKKGTLAGNYLREFIWAAYGHTHDDGGIKMRTAPSPGATYPIELHFACEDIEGTANGIYRYDIDKEDIMPTAEGRYFDRIMALSLDQKFISQCNLVVIMVYNPQKIISDYGKDSFKYAAMECGHIAQNLLLMATSLGLGAVPVGAFDRKKLGKLIGIDDSKEALYMVTIGMLA